MNNVFFSARLKLTGQYLVIILLIVLSFSGFLYYTITSNLKENVESEVDSNQAQQVVIERTIDNFQHFLLIADIITLFIAGGLSYVVAGRTLRPIQKALQLQAQFTADASHELRTPLAIMKTSSEVALRDHHVSMEKIKAVLLSNLEEIERMSNLAEDLLLTARMDSEPNITNNTLLDITALVRRCMAQINSLAQDKKITLTLKKETNTYYVRGNDASLERAIMNVLKNAIDYTMEHGSITITIQKTYTLIHIEITDTGIGISSEDLPYIFDRFYKADAARQHQETNGLGLAITKQIIEQHYGTITAASAPTKGTTFTIKLPIGRQPS